MSPFYPKDKLKLEVKRAEQLYFTGKDFRLRKEMMYKYTELMGSCGRELVAVYFMSWGKFLYTLHECNRS